jgi:DNA repair exonuclease SbcCD nuclease subunit
MKIAHLGDGHLGKRQYGLKVREEDSRRAISACFRQAIINKCDVIIIPGDMFDVGTQRSARDVLHLQKEVDEAKRYGIRVIGIDGNHDGTDVSWLAVCGVELFHKHEVIDIDGITFYGINNSRPNAFKEELTTAVNEFIKLGQSVDILIIHQALAEMCNFQGADLTADWISEQVSMIGTRYVAMGDIHDYSDEVFNEVLFCYPGSCEMTALGERREKYWAEVEIEAGIGLPKLKKQQIPVRQIKEYILSSQDDITQMIKEITDEYKDFLIIARVSEDIIDGTKIVHSLAHDLDVLMRVMRFKEEDREDDTLIEKVPIWERSETTSGVMAAIEEYHEPDSDEHQLITAMLSHPQSTTLICQGWLENDSNQA